MESRKKKSARRPKSGMKSLFGPKKRKGAPRKRSGMYKNALGPTVVKKPQLKGHQKKGSESRFKKLFSFLKRKSVK